MLSPLTVTAEPLLRAIQAGGFDSVADLATRAGRGPKNISRDLARLDEAGLIIRDTAASMPTLSPAALDQLAAIDRANEVRVLHADIEQDPLNPRRTFDAAGLAALADSIYDDGKFTLLQPLVIRRREGGPKPFRLVAGERRWRAIGLLIADGRWPADMPVPVSIREMTDEEAAVLALVENMQREDLSPVDEALTFQHLTTELKWSTADIAAKIRKTQEFVQQRMRVLSLPDEIQARMRLPKTDENRIGFKEARRMFTVSKEPARPKAPELSPKLALALLELAHKIESAPMIVGEPGHTVLTSRPVGGALATLHERKIISLREWDGQVFAKIQLYSSGALTYLEDSGFYGPKRDEVLWAARTAVMSPQRASEATRGGLYITPELNTTVTAQDEAEPEADEEPPVIRGEHFSPEVQEASLAAYIANEAREGARYGRIAGTTTIEGETWPEGATEVFKTPWDGYPRATIGLSASDQGRWFAATSTQAGGPSYSGRSSPFGVYTNDLIFRSRAEALTYAAAKVVRELGDWGKKRNLQDWLASLGTERPLPAPEANPVRPGAQQAVTSRMAEIAEEMAGARETESSSVSTSLVEDRDDDADEEALDALIESMRMSLSHTLGEPTRWSSDTVTNAQLGADAVTAFMGGQLIDAVIALMGLYHRMDEESAERLLRKAAEGSNRPEGQEPEAKLWRAAQNARDWMLHRYDDVQALPGIDDTYRDLSGALNDLTQAKKAEAPLLVLRSGDVVEKYPGGATAHRLLAREDGDERLAFRAQPIRNGKDYGKPAKLALTEVAAFAKGR